MRKWLPFILLLMFIFVLVNILLFTGQTIDYIPQTSDPSVVYKEACLRCHGELGEGSGLLYPDISNELLNEEGVINIVRNGELFMPTFPLIPDSTLKKLASYVAEKKFLNK